MDVLTSGWVALSYCNDRRLTSGGSLLFLPVGIVAIMSPDMAPKAGFFMVAEAVESTWVSLHIAE